jgi:hypothetical protein
MLSALTLWQPMSWAICTPHPLAKDIENRPRPLPKKFQGKETIVAVHAGRTWSDEYANKVNQILGVKQIPCHRDSCIVGLMKLTGRCFAEGVSRPCVEGPDGAPRLNPWWSGPYGYEIADAVELTTPIPCRGMQGFWPVPADVVRLIIPQITLDWHWPGVEVA